MCWGLFVLPFCLNIIRPCRPCPRLFLPLVEMKTQSRVIGVGCLFRVPALSCSSRRSSLLSSVVVGRSRHHRVIACGCLLAPCPSLRFAVPVMWRRCSCFVPPPVGIVRFAVSCPACRVAAFSSIGCSLRACLPCDGVPYRPPPRFIRQDGRGDAADDPAA